MCLENDPDIALRKCMEKLIKVADKHAPLRKHTARYNSAPWLSKELKALMTQCDNSKKVANQSGCLRLSDAKNNSKEIWKTLNEIMRRKLNMNNTYCMLTVMAFSLLNHRKLRIILMIFLLIKLIN